VIDIATLAFVRTTVFDVILHRNITFEVGIKETMKSNFFLVFEIEVDIGTLSLVLKIGDVSGPEGTFFFIKNGSISMLSDSVYIIGAKFSG